MAAAHLKQELVFGDSLDRFKEVGVQAEFMFQLLLALLVSQNRQRHVEFIVLVSHMDILEGFAMREGERATWKKAQSEHCLHKLSERGLFWQYAS